MANVFKQINLIGESAAESTIEVEAVGGGQ